MEISIEYVHIHIFYTNFQFYFLIKTIKFVELLKLSVYNGGKNYRT